MTKWNWITLILTTLGVTTSCAFLPSHTLVKDNYAAPLDSNYYSAEMDVQGHKYIGVAAVVVSDTLKFVVHGVHDGTITVKSDECHFEHSQAYYAFSKVVFRLDMLPQQRCLVSVFIYPYFSEKESDGIPWRGLQGLILVRSDKHSYASGAYQIARGGTIDLPLNIVADNTRFILRGCGQAINSVLNRGPQSVKIDFGLDHDEKICVLDGFLKSSSQDQSLDFLVTQYKSSFMRLPCPAITLNDRSLDVHADHSVSLIGNNETDEVFSREASFPYIGYSTIRTFTQSGRITVTTVDRSAELGKGIECFR